MITIASCAQDSNTIHNADSFDCSPRSAAIHRFSCSAYQRVHGEFLLMPRLAFGIGHDNVSASAQLLRRLKLARI